MTLEDFTQSYHQQVLARCSAEEDGQMREEAFTNEILEDLTDAGEISESEPCYYRSVSHGKAPATKINACCFSGDGATLDLFVCIYNDEDSVVIVPSADVVRHFKLARGFLVRALAGFYRNLEESHEAYDVARRIYEQREIFTNVRIFVLTDGLVKLPKDTRFEIEGVDDLELRPVLWDIAKLFQFHESGRQREEITLHFSRDFGQPIPCLIHADSTQEYWTCLAFFPGEVLARIYGDHGPRLLERNVRSFLQVRGKVNKGIQQTIAETPHRFLAYNNGITATAGNVELEMVKEGLGHLSAASDFQIVNGAQTTASLYHAWKKEKADISKVFVQVKLTLAKDAQVLSDLVPLISAYANSQNKVNTADFSANGPFHQKLEELSRTTWTPALGGIERGTRWYYERARGSYLDDKSRAGTPSQVRAWERDHPLTQKFTKTDLAKFENSWDEQPFWVSRGAEKNFAHWTASHEDEGWPVVNEQYFRRLAAKAILFRRAEQIVSAQGYPGYRANIVTYSLSWLVRRSERRIDLDSIWRDQAIPSAIAEAIDRVANSARRHITTPPGGRNITEWCKREECWIGFMDTTIGLPSGWEGALSTSPIETPLVEGNQFQSRWESVRIHFLQSVSPVGPLSVEAKTKWPVNRWHHPAGDYAKLSWEQLQLKRAFSLAKQKVLVETLEWALENGRG